VCRPVERKRRQRSIARGDAWREWKRINRIFHSNSAHVTNAFFVQKLKLVVQQYFKNIASAGCMISPSEASNPAG
jgi:hypothetical protein